MKISLTLTQALTARHIGASWGRSMYHSPRGSKSKSRGINLHLCEFLRRHYTVEKRDLVLVLMTTLTSRAGVSPSGITLAPVKLITFSMRPVISTIYRRGLRMVSPLTDWSYDFIQMHSRLLFSRRPSRLFAIDWACCYHSVSAARWRAFFILLRALRFVP